MATRAQAVARATELNCRLDDDGGCVHLDAPTGYRFGTDDCHFRDWYYDGFMGLSKPEIWADVLDRLSMGLTECDDPKCDCCHPVED